MHIVAEAIVLAVRLHGESGAVARALTRDDGMQPGYVRGGRSRQYRPVLLPANLIRGEWRARTGEQLASLVPELLTSRAALHGEPLAAAGIEWACALAAAVLPEAQPYPRVYEALGGLLDAVAAAPAARDWAAAMARYELLLLAELGFGLDLDRCVASGLTSDLAYVSPRSGAAVSMGAAFGYEAKLLPLPAFLREGGGAEWPAIFDALRITGHFLERDLLVERQAKVAAARARLVDRLKRAVA